MAEEKKPKYTSHDVHEAFTNFVQVYQDSDMGTEEYVGMLEYAKYAEMDGVTYMVKFDTAREKILKTLSEDNPFGGDEHAD